MPLGKCIFRLESNLFDDIGFCCFGKLPTLYFLVNFLGSGFNNFTLGSLPNLRLLVYPSFCVLEI